MPNRSMQYIRCVSHGCEMWNGLPLVDEDIRALARVHALVHYNRPITPADLFGDHDEGGGNA